jgi:hypothetical protein
MLYAICTYTDAKGATDLPKLYKYRVPGQIILPTSWLAAAMSGKWREGTLRYVGKELQ